MRFTNDTASAGGLLGFITLVLICGFLTAILGMGVDALVVAHNGMVGTYPTSQDSVNTGVNLVIGFRAMAFLLLLAIGLNFLNVAQQEGGGDV
jgi:hypothetical protein